MSNEYYYQQPQPGQPQPGQPAPGGAVPYYVKKNPWYLRWWAITLGIVGVVGVCCFGALAFVLVGTELDSDSADNDEDSSVASDIDEEENDVEAGTEAEEESEADYFSSTFPVFAAFTESGSGDSVIDLPAGQGIVTASHTGSSNFILTTLDESNEMSDLLVNTIGNYEGTSAYGLDWLGMDSASLQITADGPWEVTIAPIADAPKLGDPEESQGDGVYQYSGGAANWALTHQGEGNFIVTYISDSLVGWDLLANEIGNYEGTVAVTSGPAVVTVNARGTWAIMSS
ncbi:hypothetical protein [Natronoglycomyces albus]|uniref:Uncharacterized protein n=1 Tax=Natronoglycomyces albus TaxID=2811108 RepID=A0A895XPD1_9ACTN|nr:hypothetical protein [Natronoglycomyces albus]QSB05239.1 hypothetical protein JQS30_16030 [Natronoglycomyces albus]